MILSSSCGTHINLPRDNARILRYKVVKNVKLKLLDDCLTPADRLRGVTIGMTDVEPHDQQAMSPEELNTQIYVHVTRAVGPGERLSLPCPRGINGRYLIVQIIGRQEYLTVCEFEAGTYQMIWYKGNNTKKMRMCAKDS